MPVCKEDYTMNEKERIIELVKQGVISMDEALRLLEAGNSTTTKQSDKQSEASSQPKVEKSPSTFDSMMKAGSNVFDAVIGAGSQVISELSEVGSSVMKDVNDTLEERERAKARKGAPTPQTEDRDHQSDAASVEEEEETIAETETEEVVDTEQEKSHQASECQTKGQLLAQEIEDLNQELKDLQEQIIICQQRQREFEIYAELDELTAEMEEEVQALEKEEADLAESVSTIEEELSYLLDHQERLYDKCQENQVSDSEFERFIKNSGRMVNDFVNEQSNTLGGQASREGKRIGRDIANFVRSTVDRLATKQGKVTINTPWVKTSVLDHQYQFEGQDLQQIDVDTLNGDLTLEVIEGDQVLLDAHFKYFGNMDPLTLETVEDLVTVEVVNDTLIVHSDINRLGMDVHLQVPAKAYDQLSLASTNGDIQIKGIETDDLEVESQQGDIKLEALSCRQLSLESTNGDIQLDQVKAELTQVELVSGDITVSECELDSLSIENVNGDIRIVGTVHDLEAETVNGDCYITKQNVGPSHVVVENVRGDIKISFPASQGIEADLETTMGDCKYRISQLDQEDRSRQGREIHLSRQGDSQAGLFQLDLQTNMGDIYLKEADVHSK